MKKPRSHTHRTDHCFVLAIALVAGCVTDYGRKPNPVAGSPNTYEFTVYYSGPIEMEAIRERADQIASTLTEENKCSSYSLQNLGNKLPGDRYFDYKVTLECN